MRLHIKKAFETLVRSETYEEESMYLSQTLCVEYILQKVWGQVDSILIYGILC